MLSMWAVWLRWCVGVDLQLPTQTRRIAITIHKDYWMRVEPTKAKVLGKGQGALSAGT